VTNNEVNEQREREIIETLRTTLREQTENAEEI
jgi:hypothetical protein